MTDSRFLQLAPGFPVYQYVAIYVWDSEGTAEEVDEWAVIWEVTFSRYLPSDPEGKASPYLSQLSRITVTGNSDSLYVPLFCFSCIIIILFI